MTDMIALYYAVDASRKDWICVLVTTDYSKVWNTRRLLERAHFEVAAFYDDGMSMT